jgi:peptidyl-prolyl cis-trans isomerase SurA
LAAIARWVLAALVVLVSADGSTAAVMLDRVVAVVNNEAITWSELYRAMEFELSRQMKAVPDEQKREIFKENEEQFLESMIDLRLQLQEAKRLGITVSDDEVENAIKGIKSKYSMDDETFAASLKTEGFTLQEYRERLREQIVMGRLVDREVRSKMLITEDDIKSHSAGVKGGLYRIRQMFFKVPEGVEDGREALSRKVSMVMEKLASGEDFSALAAEYSEDPSAKAGGDVGFIKKSQLSGELLEALDKMSPGDVSEPIWTDRGVQIIKLEEVKGIRDIVTEELFDSQYKAWLKGLRGRSFIDVRL